MIPGLSSPPTVAPIPTVLNAGASVAGVSAAISTLVDGGAILIIKQPASGQTYVGVPATSGNALVLESPSSHVEIICGSGAEIQLRPADSPTLRTTDSAIGFLGAAPAARPTVTGSKVSGAALVSLLAALVTLGLITDSTTA